MAKDIAVELGRVGENCRDLVLGLEIMRRLSPVKVVNAVAIHGMIRKIVAMPVAPFRHVVIGG